jgi:hypothetical protein
MMKIQLTMLATVAALFLESGAVAGTCKIETARPAGEWTFVQVHDADTGEIVLQKAIMGGTSRDVTVKGERVRVDSKLPGATQYKAGTVSVCKDGNVVRI